MPTRAFNAAQAHSPGATIRGWRRHEVCATVAGRGGTSPRTLSPRKLGPRTLAGLWCLIFALWWTPLSAGAPVADERHPLEIEALTAPQQVLDRLPAARAALPADAHAERARLALAEANACRVIANWGCQRLAGSAALESADRTDSVYLQVRARIALGRALSRLGDYTNASRLMTEARQKLEDKREPALMADVLLAYSSISAQLGKLDESYRYAREGLDFADADKQPAMRIRLLRNMAKIAGQSGRTDESATLLTQAERLLPAVQDPKLSAEVLLERANAARAAGDADTVEARGREIVSISAGLQNTQIRGMGFETIGHARRMRGRQDEAYAEYLKAHDAFADLGLYRDQLRVLRDMVELHLRGVRAGQMNARIAELLALNEQVARIERESASADFEERLRYLQSETELKAARIAAENARLRTAAVEQRSRYLYIIGALMALTLAGMAGLSLQQRRYARAMRERGREMEHAVATDFLTDVHSRRHITEAGRAAVAEALARDERMAVAVIDVDHFKRINDRYGHDVGDQVLKAVADAMRAICRDTDMLGRLGGEEFVALLRGIPDAHAFAAAERLREAVAQVRVPAGTELIAPTASVGVACLSPGDAGFDALLIRADHALYQAKSQGRDRVVVATQQTLGCEADDTRSGGADAVSATPIPGMLAIQQAPNT